MPPRRPRGGDRRRKTLGHVLFHRTDLDSFINEQGRRRLSG
jgi:hypothetical protein